MSQVKCLVYGLKGINAIYQWRQLISVLQPWVAFSYTYKWVCTSSFVYNLSVSSQSRVTRNFLIFLPNTSSYVSMSVCHWHTCCPSASFIWVQWACCSSPVLLRPRETHPSFSLGFMLLRLQKTVTTRETSDSWNSATWNTKVSL